MWNVSEGLIGIWKPFPRLALTHYGFYGRGIQDDMS